MCDSGASSFRTQLCVLHTFQASTSPLDNTTEKRVFLLRVYLQAERNNSIIGNLTLGLRVCDYEMHERSPLYETRYSTKASCEDYTAKSQARLIFTVINIALARVYVQVLSLMLNYT